MDSDWEDLECPLCMEEIDITDRYFKPCPCGYQICRFCWHHIKENLNGLCPACRRQYSENQVEFRPMTAEEVAKLKAAKKAKEREKKEQEAVAKKHVATARVAPKNLVYVIGLHPRLASEEILRQHEYFGQFGPIKKIVISRRASGPSGAGPTPSNQNLGVYITFNRREDAAKAIDVVDGSIYEGRMLRAVNGEYGSQLIRLRA
ncbi:RING/Ubox like zinc-binding domain-containing protein [Hyaloraphidium curvatum]|nr:RING/Ubox like zinc-binding domain-containing protein [Hyaloraphidium curvatum]